MPGHWPSFVSASLWQTPQACTLISTSPTPGLGISRSTNSKSAPGLGTSTDFMGAIAIFVVAILPPMNSHFPLLRLTQLPERCPKFLGEQLRLLPRGEVTAFREPVVVNQFGIGFLCPAPRSCIDLIGKDAHGNGD